LFASAFAVSGLVATSPLAWADPCPVLDPGCTVDDTTTTGGGVLEDTTTTGGGVLEDTTTTGGGVLEDTTTTGGGVLEDTTTTVGGVLAGGGLPPGGVIPNGGGVVPNGPGSQPGGGGMTPGGGGGTPGGDGGTTSVGGGTQGEPPSGVQGGRVLVASGVERAISAPVGSTSTTAGRPFPSFLDEGSGALFSGSRLIRTLAFPSILILIVVVFVAVQSRIDRKDPKLVLAPVRSEYVPFT
jgi:hypothetical protein